MYLFELFVPVSGSIQLEALQAIKKEMTKKFGGVTVFSRSPAKGTWQDEDMTEEDDIAIFEVMAGDYDRARWISYKQQLEKTLQQEEILIRFSLVSKIGEPS